MHTITIQRPDRKTSSPTSLLLKKWANAALEKRIKKTELTIRIVNEEEMSLLNGTYRHKKGPTNVLSFPYEIPTLLGDIVICAKVVNQEAREQKKTREAHWAHIVIHGVLHLLGYDHEKEKEALKMESEEISILKRLHFDNPYLIRGE